MSIIPETRIVIAVDFDGTIVKHRFPHIGEPVPGAIEYLRQFKQMGASLLLWTMRSYNSGNGVGDVLSPAIQYCNDNGIYFWGVNENPTQRETKWSYSPKAYAHLYVDDCNAGTPLLYPAGELPHVDWSLVGPHCVQVIEYLKKFSRLLPITLGDKTYGINTAPQVPLDEPTLVQS